MINKVVHKTTCDEISMSDEKPKRICLSNDRLLSC